MLIFHCSIYQFHKWKMEKWIAIQAVGVQVGSGALREDSSSSLEKVPQCFSSAVLLDHLKSLCPLTPRVGHWQSSAVGHLPDLFWLCGFSQNLVSKYHKLNGEAKACMPRALCDGFQGSKRHAKQEFPQLPTSLAVHSRLTRSEPAHLCSVYCARRTLGNLEMRNFF